MCKKPRRDDDNMTRPLRNAENDHFAFTVNNDIGADKNAPDVSGRRLASCSSALRSDGPRLVVHHLLLSPVMITSIPFASSA